MDDSMVKLKKESEGYESVCCDMGEHYPYGTRLDFHNELIEELGVDSLAPGDIVEIRAYGVVQNKSEHHQQGEDIRKDMGIQLTSMKIKREESDRAKQLYGE